MKISLNTLAKDFPKSFEAQWIANLVRSFGGARGLYEDEELLDYWQEAIILAARKIAEAEAKGANTSAFLKRGVRSLLTDLNRKHDVRRQLVINESRLEAEAASVASGEDAESSAESPLETAEDSAFASGLSALKRDVRLALYLADDHSGYYQAFAQTRGTDREIAVLLNLDHKTVASRLRAPFFARFKSAYTLVTHLRKGI